MALIPYGLARPFLFGLDPETAHDLTISALAASQGNLLASAYRTTRGTLNITHCPHFDVSYYDESLLIVDPNFVRLAILQDTEYNKDLQPKNVKTKLNEWSTMLGLWMVYEEAHMTARDLRTGT